MFSACAGESQRINLIHVQEAQAYSDEKTVFYSNDNLPESQVAALLNTKIKLPKKVKIVAGGPNIDVNVNPNFFDQYPFIDYAVYGSGEVAFADIVESIINNKKLIAFNTSNMAWYDHDKKKQIVADYKYVPTPKVSPYCHNEELLTAMFQREHTLDPPRTREDITLPYEVTRGCPYSCTFCDWNSGLTNKVSRRREMFKDEADLFHRIGFQEINLTDANAGQYDEDVELVKYFAKKNLEDNADMRLIVNFSKLKKENNLKIYHELARGKLSPVIIVSIQDINEQVLLNIDRPSLTWDENKQIMQDLNDNYPQIIYFLILS